MHSISHFIHYFSYKLAKQIRAIFNKTQFLIYISNVAGANDNCTYIYIYIIYV